MIFRDIINNAGGNLWRMKLRTSLTMAGVVIAIATFVSMLSFGLGMQRNMYDEFTELGLFSTIQVYPSSKEGTIDTTRAAALLDQAAIRHIATIPGVNLAYPFDEFSVTVTFGDSVFSTHAQAMPSAAIQTKLYSKMRAGTAFSGDSTQEAIVDDEFLEMVGIKDPDSLVGRQIILSAKAITLDSGLSHLVQGTGRYLFSRLSHAPRDSILVRRFWMDVGRGASGEALSSFMEGLLTARQTITDTLVISGVIDMRQRGPSRTAAVVIPAATAAHLNAGDFSDDPASLMATLRGGHLLNSDGQKSGREYPRVTLNLDPNAPYEPIRDSVKALGYRTFSYADEFKEIRKFFLYFNLGLSMVGVIALVTASLGIVNTMVMSILERTREIGVLKSLGADDRDIRLLFLVESAWIGTLGASGGIVFGWLITRVARKIAHVLMERQDIPLFEPFSFPILLIVGALVFGLAVSLAAGLYPAGRAARVDPVEALRHD